jgi:hypothetical protein
MLTPAAHVRPSRLVLAQDYPTHSKSELKPRSHVEMQAARLRHGSRRDQLLEKIRQLETAAQITSGFPRRTLICNVRSEAKLGCPKARRSACASAEMLVGMFNHHDR